MMKLHNFIHNKRLFHQWMKDNRINYLITMGEIYQKVHYHQCLQLHYAHYKLILKLKLWIWNHYYIQLQQIHHLIHQLHHHIRILLKSEDHQLIERHLFMINSNQENHWVLLMNLLQLISLHFILQMKVIFGIH